MFCPRESLGCYTLLDSLFEPFNDPTESEASSACWLKVLASEGFDVAQYLKEEKAVRDVARNCWLCNRKSGPCENLRRFGESENRRQLTIDPQNLKVSWHWWIDPASETYILRDTFLDISMSKFHFPSWQYWQKFWPIMAPSWASKYRFSRDRYESLWEWEKDWVAGATEKHAKKLARKAKTKKMPKIPGAWPAAYEL